MCNILCNIYNYFILLTRFPSQNWLEEQKRNLQALKVKQALAAEEENLKNKTEPQKSPPRAAANEPGEKDSDKGPGKLPAKPSRNSDDGEATTYLDGLAFTVDGASIPVENIKGEEFRFSVSLFSKSGKPLGRTQSSDWSVWDRSPIGKDSSRQTTIQYLNSPLARKPPKSSKYTAKACAQRTEESLDNDPSNFISVLVEMQYRENPQSTPRPVGWALCSQPLVSLPNEPFPGGDEDTIRVSPGCWRLKVRKGMPNAAGKQKASVEDATDGWMLLRVVPSKLELGDAVGCSGKDLGMTVDITSVYDKYVPLEGEASPVIMSQPSLKKMTSLMRPPTGSSKPPGTAESNRSAPKSIDRKLSNISTASKSRSRSNSKAEIKSMASKKALERIESVDEDSPRPQSLLDNESKHSDSDEDDGDAVEEKDDPMSKYWTSGTPCGPCNTKYQKGDGIDLYIDSAMFLPDNIAISRCVVKVMTSELEIVGFASESFAHLNEGSSMSPVFKMKVEVRHEVINTTATALIRIDAMTTNTCESVGVGYAVVKLFSTRDREQPTSANASGVFINTGNFQLPIYGGRLSKTKLMDEHCLTAAKMPRVPCASLLVRVASAPKSADGIAVLSKNDFPQSDWVRLKLMVPAPGVYLSGCYDGHLCEPLPTDLHAFEAKASVLRGTVLSVCRQAVNACPVSRRPGHVNPPPENASKDQMDAWAQSLLVPSDRMYHVMNFSLAVPYSFHCGVSLSVDELHALPEGGLFHSNDVLYKVIFSTTPPGLLYRDNPSLLGEGIHFTHAHNAESTLRNPAFTDGFVSFHPPTIEKKLCFVLDVRTLSFQYSKAKVCLTYYYYVMSIFTIALIDMVK